MLDKELIQTIQRYRVDGYEQYYLDNVFHYIVLDGTDFSQELKQRLEGNHSIGGETVQIKIYTDEDYKSNTERNTRGYEK